MTSRDMQPLARTSSPELAATLKVIGLQVRREVPAVGEGHSGEEACARCQAPTANAPLVSASQPQSKPGGSFW